LKMAGLARPAASVSILVAFWAARERTPVRENLFLLALPLVLLFSVAPLVLNLLVRCRVCGLRLMGSKASRQVAGDRRAKWIADLEACPVCGDDGHARDASKTRWLASGVILEVQYWTVRRVTLAFLLVALIGGGGLYIGRSYRVPPRGLH
jgi:hypothetical protein